MQGTPADINKVVALYARVSTDEQREGETIASQIAELTRFAQEQGWAVARIYKDEGWSGAVLARPALDELRDEASAGIFHAVLVNDVDRLARDVTHLGIVKRDLERRGVRVIFKKLPGDDSPTQNLLVNVLGSFAEFERELIADRMRRGKRHKVEVRKQFLGSRAPYGFRYIPGDRAARKEGRLSVDPAEADVVTRMYAWVDEEGLSARQVLNRLNERGIRPQRGTVWAKSSVLRILRSETYAGVWHFNKHESCTPKNPKTASRYQRNLKASQRLRARSEWIPLVLPESARIVGRDRWVRVQQQLDRNRAFSPRNSKHVYLLSGLVRCGACRSTYVGQPGHGRFYYRCYSRCKRLPTVTEGLLDTTVWQAVAQAVLDPALITEQGARLDEECPKRATETERSGIRVTKGLEQVRVEEERVLGAYRLGILSPAQLAWELTELKRRRVALQEQQRVISLSGSTPALPTIRQSVADFCRIAAERLRTLPVEGRQQFLRLLLQEIVFEGSRVRIRGIIPVVEPRTQDPRGSGANAPSPFATADIATMAPELHGRNTPAENAAVCADTRRVEVPFELIRSIQRPRRSRDLPAAEAA